MTPILFALVAPAAAGPVEAAEHRRLTDEMRTNAGRNVWTSVEELYQKLLALEAAGESLTPTDQWLGASAARALGDIRTARARLDLGARAGGSKEIIGAIEEIDAAYGPARITVDAAWEGDRSVTPTAMPFPPDQRAAIERAGRELVSAGTFSGLLPAGEYTVAGLPMTVTVGGAEAIIAVAAPDVKASREGPYRLAYAGPRASLGVAFTSAGALNGAGSGADAALQAAPFSGGGARLGVGLEIGFTERFGAIAEVGYHNLFGAPTADGEPLEPSETYVVSGDSLHLGYLWFAGSLRFGNLWIAAGPIWGAGGGTVTGVDGYCVSGDAEAAPCGSEYPYLESEDAAYQRVAGTVTAGGGALSVSYGLVDIGPLRGAVTASGGIQTDTYRLYPWGQLAFTVAPASGGR